MWFDLYCLLLSDAPFFIFEAPINCMYGERIPKTWISKFHSVTLFLSVYVSFSFNLCRCMFVCVYIHFAAENYGISTMTTTTRAITIRPFTYPTEWKWLPVNILYSMCACVCVPFLLDHVYLCSLHKMAGINKASSMLLLLLHSQPHPFSYSIDASKCERENECLDMLQRSQYSSF